MKKIGIITEYCQSRNYGGNLQAYALVYIINKLGYAAEQIQYNNYSTGKRTCQNRRTFSIRKVFSRFKRYGDKFIKQVVLKRKFEERNNAMAGFNLSINHSERIYSDDNIAECVDDYTAVITGSDQVWNFSFNKPAYFLDFVPSYIPKFSYAASIGLASLPDGIKDMFKNSLKDYIGVSVREEDAVNLLEGLSPVPVEWVLDPTLLLSKNEWDDICAERMVEQKYVFCYFLGKDENERYIAKQFAKKHHLKIVTLPYLNGGFRKCDASFGDIKLYGVSPREFISLIKYAECVLTDSFHATVFSSIYQKEFFVFEREGQKGMGTRIYSLAKLFECEERFCDTLEKATMDYIEGLAPLDYSKETSLFVEMKNKSLEYLECNLKKAEGR